MSSKKNDIGFIIDNLRWCQRASESVKKFDVNARKSAKKSAKSKWTSEIKKTNELRLAIRKARTLAKSLKLRV